MSRVVPHLTFEQGDEPCRKFRTTPLSFKAEERCRRRLDLLPFTTRIEQLSPFSMIPPSSAAFS
jgi:hypothetical protein